MRLRLAFAMVLLVASACASSHAPETSTDSLGSLGSPDAGASEEAPPTDDPPADGDPDPVATGVEALCGGIEAEVGHALLSFSTLDFGPVPLDLVATCARDGDRFALSAESDLYSVEFALDAGGNPSSLAAEAAVAFESLATFEGACSVCLEWDGARGTILCPSLVWASEDESVKGTLRGSFRCP